MFIFLDREDEAKRRQYLEDLSRRLRRVRADLEACLRQEFLPGKQTRVRAGRLAYLDLLIEASELLGIEHELGELTGVERQVEILRVEAALGTAGMRLQAA